MEMNDPLRREKRDAPKPDSSEGGPKAPESVKPGRDNILKRMKRVDPKQSENYKQRTGQ